MPAPGANAPSISSTAAKYHERRWAIVAGAIATEPPYTRRTSGPVGYGTRLT